ncbi:MAG TPA: M48 family metallopeptidase [Catalimonadaceae bacterium]|nr:M48 family metallopeptidase [Catalimonadaceae bacterium]
MPSNSASIVKIFFQFLVLAGLFFATLFGLRQIDWLHLFQIETVSRKTEEKIGALSWELIRNTSHEIKSKEPVRALKKLTDRMASVSGIDPNHVKIHLLEQDEINAFALPDGHLIVFSGLINDCRNEAELAGVLGHEIAHIERKHVMKKLAKELGLSVLVSATTGSQHNSEFLKETVRVLSSAAYDRSLETEADQTSVLYLTKAGIDPKPFARFLARMPKGKDEDPSGIFSVSTHPDSDVRSKEILEQIGDQTFESNPVLTEEEWKSLKARVSEEIQ